MIWSSYLKQSSSLISDTFSKPDKVCGNSRRWRERVVRCKERRKLRKGNRRVCQVQFEGTCRRIQQSSSWRWPTKTNAESSWSRFRPLRRSRRKSRREPLKLQINWGTNWTWLTDKEEHEKAEFAQRLPECFDERIEIATVPRQLGDSDNTSKSNNSKNCQEFAV